MKLYYHPISGNCRRVLATIYETGRTDVELVLVDPFKGETRQPEFLALNPNAKIPVLVDGDFKLWESTAIMQYLADDSPLWPLGKLRYDVVRWQCWALAHWSAPIGKIVFERLLKPRLGLGNPDEAKIADAATELERFAAVVDGHLEGRQWLVGDGLTLADFSLAASLTHAAPAGIDLGHHGNIGRWYEGIEKLESWKKSAPPRP